MSLSNPYHWVSDLAPRARRRIVLSAGASMALVAGLTMAAVLVPAGAGNAAPPPDYAEVGGPCENTTFFQTYGAGADGSPASYFRYRFLSSYEINGSPSSRYWRYVHLEERWSGTEWVADPDRRTVHTWYCDTPAPVPSTSSPTPTPTPTGTPTVLSPEQACPTGEVQSDAFVDDDGNLHERAIDCVRWWGVASGGSDGTYRPLAGVTRAQMATFLANSVDSSGGTLPEAQRDYFADDDGSPHERSINRLAAVGVVSGKGGGYAPNELVTRAQMATFLVRAVKLRTGVALTSTVDWFPDDDASPHQPSINAAAGAGLASGAGSGGYAPEASVRRDQMASFLARVLELYVEKGATTPSSR